MTDINVNATETVTANDVGNVKEVLGTPKHNPKYMILAAAMRGKGPMTNEQICAAVGKDSTIAKSLHVNLSAIASHGGSVRRVREGGPTTYELIKDPIASPRGRAFGTKLKTAPKRAKRVLKVDLKKLTAENIAELITMLQGHLPTKPVEVQPPAQESAPVVAGNSKSDFLRRMQEGKERKRMMETTPDNDSEGADRIREGVRKVLDKVPDRSLVDAFVG